MGSGRPVGCRVFLSGGVQGISGADLATGESLGVLRMPTISDTPEDQIAVDSTGRYLFVPVRNRILVRDIRAQEWKAVLVIPTKFIHPTPTVSPDGRWLAVVAFSSSSPGGAPGGPFIHELLLYDLTKALPASP